MGNAVTPRFPVSFSLLCAEKIVCLKCVTHPVLKNKPQTNVLCTLCDCQMQKPHLFLYSLNRSVQSHQYGSLSPPGGFYLAFLIFNAITKKNRGTCANVSAQFNTSRKIQYAQCVCVRESDNRHQTDVSYYWLDTI